MGIELDIELWNLQFVYFILPQKAEDTPAACW